MAQAGAAVRRAARRVAERARGLARISAAPARTGLADRLEGRRRARRPRSPPADGASPTAVAPLRCLQEALHDPVLEAVEGDDGEAAAGRQAPARRPRARPRARPSSSFTWMRIAWKVRVAGSFFMPGMVAERLADHVGELAGPLDRPRRDDRPRDPARLAAPRHNGRARRRSRLRRRWLRKSAALCALLAHPHVERPVALEGEAALGLVELHRGDADIERRRRRRRRRRGRQAPDASGKSAPAQASGAPRSKRPASRHTGSPRDRDRKRRRGPPLLTGSPWCSRPRRTCRRHGSRPGRGRARRRPRRGGRGRGGGGGGGGGVHGLGPPLLEIEGRDLLAAARRRSRSRVAGFQISTNRPLADEQGEVLDPADARAAGGSTIRPPAS